MKILRLLLGDQLNLQHSWFKQKEENVQYAMFEMRQETDYAKHHIQKIVGFFTAMREMSEALKKDGHHVVYYKINDTDNKQDLGLNLVQLINEYDITHFEYQAPDEYRLSKQLEQICKSLKITHEVYTTEHFLVSQDFLKKMFEEKKQVIMESFYRNLRKQYGFLMEGGEPEGGKWNYDHDNRKKWNGKPEVPKNFPIHNEVSAVYEEIKTSACAFIGEINTLDFLWPINRSQSLTVLDFFCKEALPHFGSFQDAMDQKEPWLFHSRISFALNTKMLHPKEVVEAAIAAYRKHPEAISLAQVEGFIRQIAGWREYMRGIYWWKMPEFAKLNYFGHERALPKWFWTGETKMNCLSKSIKQSLEHAYAHHIQRLMVTGNFALLAGIHPDALDEWYLGIYIDAIEWVEITNTRGMSQFADGGIVGTKPYVSSANYIQKMGNYCSNCVYEYGKKTGENACPFNSLYWRFYEVNRPLLEKNPRIGMMYVTLNKMSDTHKKELFEQAEKYLSGIESL